MLRRLIRLPLRKLATSHPSDDKITQAAEVMKDGARFLEYGETALAMEAYQASLRIYPTSAAHYNIGNIYFQLKKFPDARKSWNKAIEMNPHSADAYVNLGNLELLHGDAMKAVEMYIKAMDLDPADGELNFNLGVAYEKEGKLPEAVDAYQRAEEAFKNDESEEGKAKLGRLESLLRSAKIKLASKH